MSDQCKQRRQAFINDIVEVCKRYRVLLELDEDLYGEFIEQSDIEGYGFNVGIGELERAVVEMVWDTIYGKRGLT
jgi:hypothetical protein